VIRPFSEVWTFANQIPGWFTELNASKLYDCALESRGVVVEVGIQEGRSASVLLSAARHTDAHVILVDYWESNTDQVFRRLKPYFPDVMILHATSVEAARMLRADLSLVHIDANHQAPGPEEDCVAWLPKLKSGGIVCFHDYQSGYPDVTAAVDKHCAGWQDLGAWEGLGIRRKL
jgi:predicted O-methyltransferase YrrM